MRLENAPHSVEGRAQLFFTQAHHMIDVVLNVTAWEKQHCRSKRPLGHSNDYAVC